MFIFTIHSLTTICLVKKKNKSCKSNIVWDGKNGNNIIISMGLLFQFITVNSFLDRYAYIFFFTKLGHLDAFFIFLFFFSVIFSIINLQVLYSYLSIKNALTAQKVWFFGLKMLQAVYWCCCKSKINVFYFFKWGIETAINYYCHTLEW